MPTEVTVIADLPHKVLNVSIKRNKEEIQGLARPRKAGDWSSSSESTLNHCDFGQIPSPLRPVGPRAVK